MSLSHRPLTESDIAQGPYEHLEVEALVPNMPPENGNRLLKPFVRRDVVAFPVREACQRDHHHRGLHPLWAINLDIEVVGLLQIPFRGSELHLAHVRSADGPQQ